MRRQNLFIIGLLVLTQAGCTGCPRAPETGTSTASPTATASPDLDTEKPGAVAESTKQGTTATTASKAKPKPVASASPTVSPDINPFKPGAAASVDPNRPKKLADPDIEAKRTRPSSTPVATPDIDPDNSGGAPQRRRRRG